MHAPPKPPYSLPALPLDEWQATKDTLHLWAQIVGKVRLASTTFRNHWWHAPLYVSARGLTTTRLGYGSTAFDIEFDFTEHQLVARTDGGETERMALRDGLSVAAFYDELMALLGGLGIGVEIRAEPFGVPATPPFPDDTEHASYDAAYVERFWRLLVWADALLGEFAGWFSGKQSPVHLFWHSFDLALTRFSGRRAPEREGVDAVTRESYSHEVVSFGFWPGDAGLGGPAFYSYTAPEPDGLTEQPLRPAAARWADSGGMALLRYDDVRGRPDPRRAVLLFCQTAYDAGARMAGWERDELESSAFAGAWRELEEG